MNIHYIHDLSNSKIIDLLKEHFSTLTDPNIINNYHPSFSDKPGNLFYILSQGRYREGKGKYFVVEDQGEYVCSAGWNEYEFDSSIALALTRMFVNEKYRSKYYVGTLILPIVLEEAANYPKIWMTTNGYNKNLYNWFMRREQSSNHTMEPWPEIYGKFRPIGERTIYFTQQNVVELLRT